MFRLDVPLVRAPLSKAQRLASLFLAALLVVPPPALAQETVPLWPAGPPTQAGRSGPETTGGCVGNISEATLTIYRPAVSGSNGAAVLVVPGGGYQVACMEHEGRAVAEWLTGQGFTAGVLKYRMPDGHLEVPFQDAQQGLRMLRSQMDGGPVGILGFSAGGHLASTVGTHFDEDFSGGRGGHLDLGNRPDFMVLVYPVITMDAAFTHGGSRRSLLGEAPAPELVERFSNERQVTGRTPPTFVLHAADDDVVPVDNALRFYDALVRHGVPSALHVFERGGHGFSLAPDSPAAAWAGLAETWLARVVAGE